MVIESIERLAVMADHSASVWVLAKEIVLPGVVLAGAHVVHRVRRARTPDAHPNRKARRHPAGAQRHPHRGHH